MELPELPDDAVDARLAEIKAMKIPGVPEAPFSRAAPEVPHIDSTRPRVLRPDTSDPSNYRGLGVGISAGYTLIGAMILGFGLGYLFDRLTGNTYGAVVGALFGAVLGIGAVFYLINRSERRR